MHQTITRQESELGPRSQHQTPHIKRSDTYCTSSLPLGLQDSERVSYRMKKRVAAKQYKYSPLASSGFLREARQRGPHTQLALGLKKVKETTAEDEGREVAHTTMQHYIPLLFEFNVRFHGARATYNLKYHTTSHVKN